MLSLEGSFDLLLLLLLDWVQREAHIKQLKHCASLILINTIIGK